MTAADQLGRALDELEAGLRALAAKLKRHRAAPQTPYDQQRATPRLGKNRPSWPITRSVVAAFLKAETMKKLMTQLVAAIALFLAAATPAMATTDCSVQVAMVYTDAGTSSPGMAVWSVGSQVGFFIYATDVNFNRIFSSSMLALNSGATVVMHFAASGVNCSTNATRTDLIGLYNYAS